MLACVYQLQPRALQPPAPPAPARAPPVIDRVPGRARVMVASDSLSCRRPRVSDKDTVSSDKDKHLAVTSQAGREDTLADKVGFHVFSTPMRMFCVSLHYSPFLPQRPPYLFKILLTFIFVSSICDKIFQNIACMVLFISFKIIFCTNVAFNRLISYARVLLNSFSLYFRSFL